jgi:magnesium chelatase family protein
VEAYVRKLSQPILDRIDLHIELKAAPLESLLQSDGKDEEEREQAAKSMRESVIEARARQYRRQKMLNARLSGRDLSRHARLGASSEALLRKAAERFGLSARGYVRVLRTARTIADLEGASDVADAHVAEALGYRSLQALGGPLGS